MSKPRVDPTFGISSVDVLILTERHPACRWREAQPGSCKERENLAGDAKGKGPSGPNRKAESTDAPERGGLLRSSEEAAVMVVERRGGSSTMNRANWQREEPEVQRKAAAFNRWHEPDDARVSSPDL
jgi:hypothetical protein